MGGTKRGFGRGGTTNETIPHAIAVAVIVIGTTLDSVSTIFGHSFVNGIEEWNLVIQTIAHLLPFAFAVFLIKAAALAVIVLLTVLLRKKGGPWKMCLIVPGVVWITAGLINTVTILASI